MHSQRGVSVVELVVSLFLIALMSALAVLAGVGFVRSARISKEASRFADSVSLAREKAVGRYEQWRVVFPGAGGGDIVTSYGLESCEMPPEDLGLSPDAPCPGPWTPQGAPVELMSAIGLKVPLVNGQPVVLTFDRTGRLLNNTSTEIAVCNLVKSSTGALICQPGSTGRLIRIREFSGIIET